ncbi:MAG TPA: serpin family protein [Ilumatobacteraceae bacterium]|nr:serpin family protein [Ilumatobacteraceae bacterium]
MKVRLLVVLAVVFVSCGDSGTDRGSTSDLVAVPVAARKVSEADPAVAGQAISAFGLDLFSASRSVAADSNVTVSPTSVAVALAMLEPGASGDAQGQFRSLLHIDDPATFHASMNALEQALEARVPQVFSPGDDPGEVVVRIANAAYLQKGYPFEPAYLETVGSNYGPVLNEVDFEPDPDAIAHQINAFVAEATNDKITKLIDDGVIRRETVLALVNALYLKASWLQTFDKTTTADETFTRLDGTEVKVSMMHGSSDSSASGDGWIGATKSYVGGLTAQFILPSEGRFDEIAGDLGRVFSEYDANRTEGTTLGLPRFELRYGAELTDALQSLGLTAPYANGGLLGVANDPKLVIDKVIHQTYVAMNEAGTEAAAATVVLMYPTSAPIQQPIPVVLDRPFLYRIIDDQSGATLFIGQVLDPLG